MNFRGNVLMVRALPAHVFADTAQAASVPSHHHNCGLLAFRRIGPTSLPSAMVRSRTSDQSACVMAPVFPGCHRMYRGSGLTLSFRAVQRLLDQIPPLFGSGLVVPVANYIAFANQRK